MDGRNPRDRHHLTEDLVSKLVDSGYVRPHKSIPIRDAVEFFAKRDRELAKEIITDLADGGAPVVYATTDQKQIWVADANAAEEYIGSLRENPPWFEW
jgi:hypothetical protein